MCFAGLEIFLLLWLFVVIPVCRHKCPVLHQDRSQPLPYCARPDECSVASKSARTCELQDAARARERQLQAAVVAGQQDATEASRRAERACTDAKAAAAETEDRRGQLSAVMDTLTALQVGFWYLKTHRLCLCEQHQEELNLLKSCLTVPVRRCVFTCLVGHIHS